MSGVRSALALQRLYERYRAAVVVVESGEGTPAEKARRRKMARAPKPEGSPAVVVVSVRKPGEWLVIEPGSEDARTFAAALGLASDAAGSEVTANALPSLNGALGVVHEMDVRLVANRTARSLTLHVRFTLVRSGKGLKGSKPVPRSSLPAIVAQLDLCLPTFSESQKVGRQPTTTIASGTLDGTNVGGSPSEVESAATYATGGTPPLTWSNVVMPDGSEASVPDLSWLLFDDEVRALGVVDGDVVDRLFERTRELPLDMADVVLQHLGGLAPPDADELVSEQGDLFDDDSVFDAWLLGAGTLLASKAPPVSIDPEDRDGAWEDVSKDVVAWTVRTVKALRNGDRTGEMVVLAPSPGAGKSHGMMEAIHDENTQPRRRVGYAVRSRAQIPEAVTRLRSANDRVKLIVIEGRHPGNCFRYDKVEIATNAGFSPGVTVCPECSGYPVGRRKNRKYWRKAELCDYYTARVNAIEDKEDLDQPHNAWRQAAVIVTTHASAVLGSHLMTRRNQEFWNLDTLFIDEDPTDSMVVQHEIRTESLTYSKRDDKGHPDGPTLGTMLLQEAIREAARLRSVAAERDFLNVDGEPDRVHSRDHGSSFAGGDLHALLESVARSMGNYSRQQIGSGTIDGLSMVGPAKGEIMGLTADEVAAHYPNRYLDRLFAALEEEALALKEDEAAGNGLERAYRIHLDLTPDGSGGHHAAFRLHLLLGFANGRANVVIGDAYADVEHYEGLFNRRRRDGKVHVLKRRVAWPKNSMFTRIVTRASAKDLRAYALLREHLESNVSTVLELERGRKILFYIHKEMKRDLAFWLLSSWRGIDVSKLEPEDGETPEQTASKEQLLGEALSDAGYAIEHWASGRGKDVYKDFDTFIGVTEYMPNIGSMKHEANTVAALASPKNLRVTHWDGHSPKKGSQTFASSLSAASPFYQAVFHRKATDELAQAVHRIRPAIPAADGRQKRVYVFGHQVPLSAELIAATTATVVLDNGDLGIASETLDRGLRFSVSDTLGLIGPQEVVRAMAEVFRKYECWSHAFAHSLLSVSNWATVENLVAGKMTQCDEDQFSLMYISGGADGSSSALVERIQNPPRSWPSTASRLQRSSTYRDGLSHLLALPTLPVATEPRRLRRPWMPKGSHGYEFWGDCERFGNIIDTFYAPGARVPF